MVFSPLSEIARRSATHSIPLYCAQIHPWRCSVYYAHPFTAWANIRGDGFSKAANLSYWTNVYIETAFSRGDFAVPKKTGDMSNVTLKWVNISLTAEDKTAILELNADEISLLHWLGAKAYEGYKISFSWDNFSGAYQCALIGASAEHRDRGFAISARHPDPDMAVLTLWYKVSTYCPSGLAEVAGPADNVPSWG